MAEKNIGESVDNTQEKQDVPLEDYYYYLFLLFNHL